VRRESIPTSGSTLSVTRSRPVRSATLSDGRSRKLDADFKSGLARCARREIVTSHAAFHYLADRYELEQIGLTGVSPEAEPTARDLERIVREVDQSDATTIFFETLVSPRLAETVARETGAKTAVLNPLEGLSQEEVDQGEDYFSVMRENLVSLRQALGCR
jgi:zinc transport system substrate-binding protein